ncbi:primosomal protein N' [Frankia sp. Mgl5]|uniref:primosomal protein N' n=1 Tax=Frankia sp. Mgl5 TaxID=2933793 RepID=UPI00200E5F4C|nr:primosomal protein N' [Frankia sp. Mgl5]MCK9930412.1 primosomal protein N' [Frankia sp. Mgl5]
MDDESAVIPGLAGAVVAAGSRSTGGPTPAGGVPSAAPAGRPARPAAGAAKSGVAPAKRGAVAAKPGGSEKPGAVVPAEELPVARVVVDTPLVHLDRPFDYLVPAAMAAAAVPGSRVRVRFGGRLVDGFVLERSERSDHTGRLAPLARSVSAEPVLSEPVARLARAVADRYAGTMADVLRLAVPPRHARAEAEPVVTGPGVGAAPTATASGGAAELGGGRSGDPGRAGWSIYPDGPDFLAALSSGRSPRAVWWAPPGPSWPAMIAVAVAATVASGRGALVVVPDHRDADRVAAALTPPETGTEAGPAAGGVPAVLRADLGPAERYRRFLTVRRGQTRVVVGTRAAVFAPVADLGLLVVWDDGDDLHSEPRAPYPHTRDVAVLRAREEGCAVLVGGFSPSVDAEALARVGWAGRLAAGRDAVRRLAPRVEAVGSDFEASIDPAARAARLPSLAVRAARAALAGGAPVLVQVPRRGYHPSIACADCRRPARCRSCAGPLGRSAAGAALACRWCGRPVPRPAGHPTAPGQEPVPGRVGAFGAGVGSGRSAVSGGGVGGWRCTGCGGTRLRASVTGDRRTAEELGRAFPGIPVRTSGRDTVLATVPAEAALVIATPGAEPVAEAGYGAVLLLDGWALLGRPDLRAGEETLRRWMAASALARPAPAGGLVVVAADLGLGPVQALVRWDPGLFVARESDERAELGFPPVSRVAAVDGTPAALDDLLAAATLPAGAEVLGPVPVPRREAVPRQEPGRGAGGEPAPEPGHAPGRGSGRAQGREQGRGLGRVRAGSGDPNEPGRRGPPEQVKPPEPAEEPERLIIRVRREQGADLAAALRAARGVLDARRAGRVRVQLDPLTIG